MDRQSRRDVRGKGETIISLQNGKRLVQVSANAIKQGWGEIEPSDDRRVLIGIGRNPEPKAENV